MESKMEPAVDLRRLDSQQAIIECHYRRARTMTRVEQRTKPIAV